MEKKRPVVLLIVPRYFSTDQYGYIMPMGILYVSAALKASGVADVVTINLNHQEKEYEIVLADVIKKYDVDIAGCGGISGQFIEIYPLFETIRRIAPDVKIIAGGGMITSDPVVAMDAFGNTVDYGVIGEGEITVPELVSGIFFESCISDIPGVIFRNDEGKLIITERRKDIMDLDSLPIPDYLSFDYDKYLASNGEYNGDIKFSPVAIIGGRSCKYNCTFCFHTSGSLYRQRSLDSIFREIEFLLKHFDVNYIALREELFANDEKRVIEFCHRVIKYPIVWSIQLRVDCVNQTIVDVLSKSNCRYIFLGIESADNRILKSMRKAITIQQIEAALDMCIKAGLDTRSTIILGDEEETEQSVNRTINWWLKHKKASPIDLGLIIAFPGSTLYKHAISSGNIPDPVQFLKDGCPIINLSKHLPCNKFMEVVQKVSEYTQIDFKVKDYLHK